MVPHAQYALEYSSAHFRSRFLDYVNTYFTYLLYKLVKLSIIYQVLNESEIDSTILTLKSLSKGYLLQFGLDCFVD